MIYSAHFTCVLDTNVIYPIEVRDILFWFASYDLYTPKWSQHIWDEWLRVMLRKGVDEAEARKRIARVEQAFPDAMVKDYEGLIEGLTLPDPDDRHVLAAAIKENANLIITNNLKDFPAEYLAEFSLSAKSPDDFLTDTIDLNPDTALAAFNQLVLFRRNPNLDHFQVLDALRRNGIAQAADYLHALL